MKQKLSDISIGDEVEIVEFSDNEIKIKLMEMGFIIGETVHIEQKAPTGDPICVNVCNYMLSLRRNEADKVWVKPCKKCKYKVNKVDDDMDK